MATFKETRLLLRSKQQPSKLPSSKTKQPTLSSEKENLLYDYIRKEKIRSINKNQTCTLGKAKREEILITDSSDLIRKKSKLQDSLVCKGLDSNIKQKEQFNLTMGNKKQEKKNLFNTADVSSAIKVIKNQIKMDTLRNKTRQENMMTEEDIDHLFQGTMPQPKASARNLQINKIKQLLQTEPAQSKKVSSFEKTKNKDFADSVKFLEIQDGQDKLLSALTSQNLVKVEPEKGVDKTTKFKEQFIVGKQIGQGAYASVRIAIYTSLNKKIAIKIYQKRKIKQPQRKKSVRRQIKILQKASHKNVVKIFDVIQTNNHVNLIMEYVPGVCLSNFLKSQPDHKMQQKVAKKIFQQLVQALVYLHSQNICHRDIKLDNILLDNQLSPKLIDFGFATCIDNRKKVKMFCGTPSFMAPEIVTKQEYQGPPSDIWALGVVLFVMLTGVFPFKGQTDKELYSKICNSQYPSIQYLSAPVQNLLKMMLTVDSDQRIQGEDILSHEWLKPTSQLNQKRNSTALPIDKFNIDTYERRYNQRKKPDDSKQKKVFALTESSFTLKQMLRNVHELKFSPRHGKEDNYNDSKPSTPLLQQAKQRALIQSSNVSGVIQRLTNKAYF